MTQMALLETILAEMRKQTELLARFFGNGPPEGFGEKSRRTPPPEEYDAPPETKVQGYAGRRMVSFATLLPLLGDRLSMDWLALLA